ncbi:MAG: ribbon-helix-helix domain-containing protein [Opitutae bacterium]
MSVPADVKAYLDKMSAKTGLSRSRIMEAAVRDAMRKGQTSLDLDIRHEWKCPKCEKHFHINKKTSVLKCRCGHWLDEKTDYQGIFQGEIE